MATFKDNITQPWAIRRVVYGILSLIGALLVGFGVAEAVQVDQFNAVLERIIAPLLLTLSSGVAGAKANPGSDMKKPREEAQPTPTPTAPAPSPAYEAGNDLLHDLRARIKAARK